MSHELAESRRPATDAEIEAIRKHVADVGFDEGRLVRAGGVIVDLVWNGRVVHAKDQLHNGEVHFLKHVVRGRQWPPGTPYDEYVEILRQAVSGLDGGGSLESRFGSVRLSFVARSFEYRGPEGAELILAGYSVDYDAWATGYQPEMGLSHFVLDESRGERWLREPIP